MTEIKPGDRIKHRLTDSQYYYVGPHPRIALEVIAMIDDSEGRVYSIERQAFRQYYDVVADEIVKDATYVSKTTHSTVVVQAVAKHPKMTEPTVFGFLTTSTDVETGYPVYYAESMFRSGWERVDDNA